MAMQQMSSAFASSSKPSSSVVSSKNYDVFLSFRGEDTRRNFTSHLYEALSQKKIKTFKDDNELEKGDEISPALIKAIEESHASIVIFSENYASSKWCLDELNKILECKKCQAQIVIPVFYNIDPTHVRKQTGSYEEAFTKHGQDLKLNKDKLQKWKVALTKAANLVGWDSQNREKHPIIGYEDLSASVIAHCKGNPLALKVLGANLRSRSKEAWKSELKKLQYIPNWKIHSVLKLSYDDLDRTQKDIFLDIACFLKGWRRDRIISLLEACNFFAASGIEVLLDKTLITILRDHYIKMHDLLQEMGREIVNQESKDPGKRSRLWKPEEVYDVLKNNKGTEVVECIRFNITKVGDLYLSSDSFKRMTSLRYLEIDNFSHGNRCNVYFPDGLGWLPDKLRYLRWEACCLVSLPSTFRAEMLVELRMHHSKLKKLWDGVQNLVNLKITDLCHSKDLIDVPDLSMALNLERVFLRHCKSLRQLHPSVLSLPKLKDLYLEGCKKIESLKTSIHSKSLGVVDLSNCSSLTEFSVTSEKMKRLYLNGTAIHELLSIWRNSELTFLDLSECYKLDIAGSKLSNEPRLWSLTLLNLSRCTQINASNLWFILDVIRYLKQLNLTDCCNLEAVPDNIQNHSMLERLWLDDCRKLVSLPELPPSLKLLRAANCTSLDRDSTQRLVPVLENMLQSLYSYEPEYPPPGGPYIDAFFMLPGVRVPGKFGFYTKAEASITIPPIPKSDLCGFIFCIVLSARKNSYREYISYRTYEQGEEVDRGLIFPKGYGTWISDHMMLCRCQCGYDKQDSGGDQYNLSFEFEQGFYGDGFKGIRYSKEWIKGCGVFPLYASSKLDGGSSSEQIVELESDELQPRVGGSDDENEDDQETFYSCNEEEDD